MQKKTVLFAAIFAGVLAVAAPSAPARADVAVSFSFFHRNLSPYGRWVSVGSYGQCWAPAGVLAGWQPYTVGHWIYTDYGWTWVSSDPWGDVTYRYGTWTLAPPYGWVWVPGFVWAPSWVTWSYTDDYVGWAPIPPTFSLSVSGYVGAPVIVSRTAYVFVPTNRFVNADVTRVRVPVQDNSVILARSRKVTRFPVSGGIVRNQGPEPARIERVAKVSIPRAGAGEVGIAPVRVDAHRSGNRISVVAPASAKKTEGRAVSATGKSSSGKRSTHNEGARPPASRESQPRATHETHPSHDKDRSVKVEEKPSHGTAARPPETRESVPSRQKARPETHESTATHQARAEEHVRPGEKPAPKESAHSESARPSEPHGAPQNEKRAHAKKPPARPRPEKADKGEKPS